MRYQKEDGSYLYSVAFADTAIVVIQYVAADGSAFSYTSNGENFTIKGLAKKDDTTLEATDDQSVFATFVKGDPISVVTFVHCGLVMNVKTLEMECPEGSHTSEEHGNTHTDEILEQTVTYPIWNYDQNGAEWPEVFPNCGQPQQSPINLMKPTSEYGNSYYLYSFVDDNSEKSYADLENPLIKFENDRYALEVQISHENGYAGFTSYIGEKLYQAPLAPKKWDAAYFTVRKGAEHTIEDVRHDLELQVVHIPHVNTAEEDLG